MNFSYKVKDYKKREEKVVEIWKPQPKDKKHWQTTIINTKDLEITCWDHAYIFFNRQRTINRICKLTKVHVHWFAVEILLWVPS